MEQRNQSNMMYYTLIQAKFINILLKKGNKNKSERIFNDTMSYIAQLSSDNPIIVLEKSVDNARPLIELKPIRVAGVTYRIPFELNRKRQTSIAIRWIIETAKLGNYNNLSLAIANEVIKCYNNQGSCIKKKEEIHRIGESNRAFAHFRW